MEHETPRLYIPRKLGRLRAWLRDTEAGRELVRDATEGFLESECRTCQKRRPYPKVLVVVRRLGRHPGVEVFHEKGVTVRLEELVDSEDDKAMEILVEELLVHQLPRSWKTLVTCRSDSQVFTGLTAERKLRMVELRDWLNVMSEFREEVSD